MIDERPHLAGLTAEELPALLAAQGVDCDVSEARRAMGRLIAEGRGELAAMRHPIRKTVRLAIEAGFRWDLPVIEERVDDPEDNSVRYLFRAADGARFEAVRIGLHKEGRFTVCLSSQAGCAMACAFCATGRLGLTRNLTAAEIVGQFLVVRSECPGRLHGAVFMGQGEPLHNYDAVIQAARVLAHPCGGRISQEAITISTVGLVPQIRRYTAEDHPYRLIVSLTSAVPERRADLLPVAGRVPFPELIDALRDHAASLRARSPYGAVGERLTVAWVLIGGVNHGPDEVAALREQLGDLPIRVNLIDVNDPRPDGFRRATPAELKSFLNDLGGLGVPVVRRYSVGRSRHSACGMLACKKREELEAAANAADPGPT